MGHGRDSFDYADTNVPKVHYNYDEILWRFDAKTNASVITNGIYLLLEI